MTTIRHDLIFFLLCLCLTMTIIYSYPLIEEEDLSTALESNEIYPRSVLWPKICFLTMESKSRGQLGSDIARNVRKCYPFDAE